MNAEIKLRAVKITLEQMLEYAESQWTLEEIDAIISERGEWEDGDDTEREKAASAETVRNMATTLLEIIGKEI